MSNHNRIIWPGWETVRLIGRGSFGAVYEIQRKIRGRTEHAALKVISIPQSASEIQELKADGYDSHSISQYFNDSREKIEEEYAMMADLKGHSNVVYCDDIRTVQKEDGFGWDVYIKMELLTPSKIALGDEVSDAQVIALGTDISNALMLCEKLNIVHRDIKPENIFVARDGSFKLGDFGIAKTMEGTSGGTRTGTYDYMAPEVYNNQPYYTQADIYSLGLVLYWLLNDRTAPFLKKRPTPSEKTAARERRFSGEQIPAPKNGSEELQRIVLKACAFDPADRYQSAAEMHEDLLRLSGGTVTKVAPKAASEEDEEEEEKTVGPVFKAASVAEEEEEKTVGPVFKFTPVMEDDEEQKTVGPVFTPNTGTKNDRNELVDDAVGERKTDNKKPSGAIAAIAAVVCIALVALLILPKGTTGQATSTTTKQEQPKSTVQTGSSSQTTSSVSQKAPSQKDVEAFGDVIAYPLTKSYLPAYETMYVKSTKGHSIYVYWKANGDSSYKRKYLLYEKDEVTVLAREDGFSCVIFTSKDGTRNIGWVNSNLLVSVYE